MPSGSHWGLTATAANGVSGKRQIPPLRMTKGRGVAYFTIALFGRTRHRRLERAEIWLDCAVKPRRYQVGA